MVRAAALGLALVVAGCDDGPVSRSEAQDIASDYATDTSELDDRLNNLEAEVQLLRGENAKRAASISTNASNIASAMDRAADNEKRLYSNDKRFWTEANRLRAKEGLPPIEWQE